MVLRFPLLNYDKVDLSSFLPSNLFNANLRVLEISFVNKCHVPLPSISPASVIQDMNIHGVILPQGDANGELELSFSVAKVLRIDLCDVSHLKVLTVSAPVVEKLWLCLDVQRKEEKVWWYDPSVVQEEKVCNVKVKMHTPEVRSLTLATFSSKSFVPVRFSIEDELLYLDRADIHICTDDYVDEESSQSLIKILQKCYNAQSLELSISTEQVLTDFATLSEGLPHQFQNLKYILLGDRMKFPRLYAMTNFLLSFPCIETFVWKKNWSNWNGVTNEPEESVANEMEAVKSNLPFQSMLG